MNLAGTRDQPSAWRRNRSAVDGRQSDSILGRLATAIAAAIETGPATTPERIKAALSDAVLAPELLTPGQQCPSTDGYARHILHEDRQGRFTVLAIVWSPGQFSPVHAHSTWCAYAVRGPSLRETIYQYDAACGEASPLRSAERRAGYACFSQAGLDQIHRLGNVGPEVAISIHAYGVEADRVSTGVNRLIGRSR